MNLQPGVFIEVTGGKYKTRFGKVLQEKGKMSVLIELHDPIEYTTIRRFNVTPYYDIHKGYPLIKKESTKTKETMFDNKISALDKRIEELAKEVARLTMQVENMKK